MIIGLNLGKAKKKGSWILGVNQRTIELNSLYATFMDSNFAGQTTDSAGTILWGKYLITDKSYLSFGYFQNTKNSDKKANPNLSAQDFNKLQIDYAVKF